MSCSPGNIAVRPGRHDKAMTGLYSAAPDSATVWSLMPHPLLDRTLRHLERLIAFDTVSRNSNLALIDRLEEVLAAAGLRCRRITAVDADKAGLLAVLGPPDRPGLLLSGHTDVVPVDGQEWSSDPFEALLRDGRVYGRGAADMKGFLACMLAIAETVEERELPQPLVLAFSWDEEVGCRGVPALIGALFETVATPLGCFVGEPTGMRVADAHKGKIALRCTVTGREAHSALPGLGANAVFAAAELVRWLEREAERLAEEGPFEEGFDPPFTTVNLGVIEGGEALNIVPRRCVFLCEFRTLPGEDPEGYAARLRRHAAERVLPRLRRRTPEAAIAFETLAVYPGLRSALDTPFARACLDLRGSETPLKLSFGTEAGHFARAGIPALVCGPGDIAVAHKPDEHLSLEQLSLCLGFLERLVRRDLR